MMLYLFEYDILLHASYRARQCGIILPKEY